MNIIAVLNPEHLTDASVAGFSLRRAARAVVRDAQGRVALLHVSKCSYYKLPGGGLEGDEDVARALARECREEIGCELSVGAAIGEIVEYRAKFRLKQISYCYHATVVGEKRSPDFTPSEIEEGFAIIWVPAEEAVRLVAESTPTDYHGSFIVERDAAFLRAAFGMPPPEPKKDY